jgi:hypothetical protein
VHGLILCVRFWFHEPLLHSQENHRSCSHCSPTEGVEGWIRNHHHLDRCGQFPIRMVILSCRMNHDQSRHHSRLVATCLRPDLECAFLSPRLLEPLVERTLAASIPRTVDIRRQRPRLRFCISDKSFSVLLRVPCTEIIGDFRSGTRMSRTRLSTS